MWQRDVKTGDETRLETNGLEDGSGQGLREPVSQRILSSLQDLRFLRAGNQGLASLADGCRAFGTDIHGVCIEMPGTACSESMDLFADTFSRGADW